MISYAQAREDILLHRALHHVQYHEGFYIDVGAYHPTQDSVTRHFYDHGWRGINVEPGAELFPDFVTERPRDVNLQVAVSDRCGDVTFHAVEGQLGTLEERFAERHVESGFTANSYVVPAMTLGQICDQHAPTEIHFLKIDVEGHEGSVIRGMDFKRHRPWVLVIEATEPNRLDVPTYDEWDGLVLSSGYSFAYTDVLNRYYVANEHRDLMVHFTVPADNFRQVADVNRIRELEGELAIAEARIAGLAAVTGIRQAA